MTDLIHRGISRDIDEAIRRLVTVEHFKAGSLVSMPVTYPSGASVVLEISEQKGRCVISDRAGGYQEAELIGASRYYKKEAPRVADAAGIRFDGLHMFVVEVPKEVLSGAMVVVANCSAEAANAATLRHAEHTDRDAKDDLFLRLSALYRPRRREVEKDAEMQGARHKWRVSVAVYGGEKAALFEPVSGVYISAVGTTAKFYDFATTSSPPSRYGVVRSLTSLGDFYSLVAGSSTKLLPASASDEEFLKLLEAA